MGGPYCEKIKAKLSRSDKIVSNGVLDINFTNVPDNPHAASASWSCCWFLLPLGKWMSSSSRYNDGNGSTHLEIHACRQLSFGQSDDPNGKR